MEFPEAKPNKTKQYHQIRIDALHRGKKNMFSINLSKSHWLSCMKLKDRSLNSGTSSHNISQHVSTEVYRSELALPAGENLMHIYKRHRL